MQHNASVNVHNTDEAKITDSFAANASLHDPETFTYVFPLTFDTVKKSEWRRLDKYLSFFVFRRHNSF